MKPDKEDKAKATAPPVRVTNKTKDDFLRWWREKLLKEQTAEEQNAQADHPTSRALMVWADDGGPAT
jgi:hypothetical protein